MLLIISITIEDVLTLDVFQAKLFYNIINLHKMWVLDMTHYLTLNQFYNNDIKCRHNISYVVTVFSDNEFGIQL